MKKIFYFLSALALMAGFVACEEKEEGGIDFSEIVLDGFYVYGDATGSDKVVAANAMAAGYNEAVEGKPLRPGMYEKYIWLEKDKDFALIMNSAGNMTFYGAALTEVNYGYDENDPDCKNFADNPNMIIQQGKLIIGEDAPKMRVKETGLYHIVLDNNTDAVKIPTGAQIIVQKADWGVRGGMNSWGFTAGEVTKNDDGSITYTWTDQKLAANGEFKFASCHGWKINLDVDGTVKAEVGLGLLDGKLHQTGANIVAGEKGGLYKITLTYTPKAGALGDSFSYNVELTQESSAPTTMYIIGNDFGDWKWDAETVVEMTPVNGATGIFWAVRYMTTATEFKFCALKEWNGDFCTLGENTGFVTPGNNKVEADGLYLIYVDVNDAGKIAVSPAKVCGLGDAFGGWDATNGGQVPMTVNADGTASITATADGLLRSFAQIEGVDAWKSEFSVFDGKIVYRGNGGDFSEDSAVKLTSGQTVTYNFNAGTATIQ